jgi:hypothetical protein
MIVTENTKALAADIITYWNIFEKHDQGTWVDIDNVSDLKVKTKTAEGREWKVCNTTMCAAGTAVFLSSTKAEFMKVAVKFNTDDSWWSEEGANLLGLNDREARGLFMIANNEKARALMQFIADGDANGFSAYRAENIPQHW